MKQLLLPLVDLWQLFFPEICAACKNEKPIQGDLFCLDCLLELPFTDHCESPQNEFKTRFSGRVELVQAAALLYFSKKSRVQTLVHDLKYKGNKQVGTHLGASLGIQIKKHWKDLPDLIIPVPITKKKRSLRGFNQTEVFADGISEILHIPIDIKSLSKENDGSSQTSKSRIERFENVLDSFKLQNQDSLKGKHILVLDDVCTTGATLEACAMKLQKIPDIKISFAIIALAE